MTSAPAFRALFAALVLGASPASALTFDFPGTARVAAGRSAVLTSFELPLGPWAGGALPVRRVEGVLEQTAWQVEAPDLTTLQLLAPLRDQLLAEGFRILWECDTANCGGFDFRYAIDVLPEPDMHVDLGDFRFLAAERNDGNDPEVIGLLVSRSARQGYVQVTHVGGAVTIEAAPEDAAPVAAAPAAAPLPPAPGRQTDIARALEERGAFPLDDLTFATGSAELGPGDFASLRALADYLAEDPGRRVALVGHTDASGELAGNVALSKARAASVRDRLIRDHGAPPDRVTAEGVGYLAPRASNLTEEGRRLNRRVEVVLTRVR